METFKLPLPFTTGCESRLLDVSGERKLRGGADTGVFKILSIGEQLATLETQPVSRDEDGLALALWMKLGSLLDKTGCGSTCGW